jgi:predicted esterase
MRWAVLACGFVAVVTVAGDAGTHASASASASADADARANADAVAIKDAARPRTEKDDPDRDSIDEVEVEGDLPVYVVRTAKGVATARAVFLTGSCTTPLTYLRAFRQAAAEHGGIVALQGDRPCRDGSRRWSPDTVGTSARIEAALRAAGIEDANDVTLVGYSQGAERAEWLAHRFPAKYTRFVLMAGPIVPSRVRFENARAVVTLAGYGDVRENMAGGAKRLRRAAIHALYMELPGGARGRHGELPLSADRVVARAFDWLDSNAAVRTGSRPAAGRPSASSRCRTCSRSTRPSN